MRHETFTLESLIRIVAARTGERFEVTGDGKKMRLHLADQDACREFSAKGRTQIVRYLQGMIRAANAIAARHDGEIK